MCNDWEKEEDTTIYCVYW